MERVVPQKAERWAMYKMICPIVDVAAEATGLLPYFEYVQPNRPNASDKVDIALLEPENGYKPVWYIEAKKYGARIDSGMVADYLARGGVSMGVVTDGNMWIITVAGHHTVIGPVLSVEGNIVTSARAQIIELLMNRTPEGALSMAYKWSADPVRIKGQGPAILELQAGRGTRAFAAKTSFADMRQAVVQAAGYARSGSITQQFLDHLASAVSGPTIGRIEVSEKRLIWWNDGPGRRARINLEASQLEILLAADIFTGLGPCPSGVIKKMHDKNPDMVRCTAGDLTAALFLSQAFLGH